MTDGKNYHFRVYYLTKDTEAIRKIKDKFNTTVSVNGESHIYTDPKGVELIHELVRLRFISIRHYEEIHI